MTTHENQPKICADCETMARATAEQANPNHLIPWVCEHNRVVAVGFMSGNAIVSWMVEGPLSIEAAQAAVARILVDAERHHMSLHKIRKPQ
jgi:hypothetical protein